MKHIGIALLLVFFLIEKSTSASDRFLLQPTDSIAHFEMGEIIVVSPYHFETKKEERQYARLERDIREVYPLLQALVQEYYHVKKLLPVYSDKESEYLKWFETYGKKKYLKMTMSLSVGQAKLLLKLLERELNRTPEELLESYKQHNGKSSFWQKMASVYISTLGSEYDPEESPMIEHIMNRIKEEEAASLKKKSDTGYPIFEKE